MARCWLVLVLIAACTIEEPETSEATQASTSSQGTSAQGTSAQGTSAQGTSAQGTSAQGTTSGGASVSDAKVVGTALQFWRSSGVNWLQYKPNQICVWNSTRTFKLSCTSYDLATQPSPLAGTRWPMTFIRKNANGTTTRLHLKVQIGASASSIGAVKMDTTTTAMFDLKNSGATGALVGCGDGSTRQCRRNSDLFLYDVKVIDFDDTMGNLCPAGERAFAVAGTWDSTATFHASTSQFTFACTNGTIAKCVRWGYRPWASAVQTNDPENKLVSLAGYHQTCVRAAMADYCGNGYSFTQDGTIIEFYDYSGSGTSKGFIPYTGTFVDHFTATAFEGHFDQLGGYIISHTRYAELEAEAEYDVGAVCPGRFITDTFFGDYAREGLWTDPRLYVSSTPGCSHTELMVGKWLAPSCSKCTPAESSPVPDYCNDPLDSRGWDAGCVQAALSCPVADRMSPTHSECTTGAGLNKYTSGCTLKMSMKGYASCFNPSSATAWTATCVAAANSICTGGQEHLGLGGMRYGFCNQLIPLGNQLEL